MYFEELEKQFIQRILKSKHTDLPGKSISWYAGCRQTRKTVLQNQLYIQNNTTNSLHGSKNPQISPHIIMTTHSRAHGTNSTLESNSWNVKERMLEMLENGCFGTKLHALVLMDFVSLKLLKTNAPVCGWLF